MSCSNEVVVISEIFWCATNFNNGGSASINNWNTSSVTIMDNMFRDSPFNQNIENWNTSNVTNMYEIFNSASDFNQDITGWCVTNITTEPEGFGFQSALTIANKPVWGICPNYNINVTASSNSDYTLSGSDRNGVVTGNDLSITINSNYRY